MDVRSDVGEKDINVSSVNPRIMSMERGRISHPNAVKDGERTLKQFFRMHWRTWRGFRHLKGRGVQSE